MKTPSYGSGVRDRLVTIQQLTESIGTSHAPVESWQRLCEVMAFKDDLSGRERFVANQPSAPYDSRWELPFRSDCDPERIDVPKTRRIVHQGRVYDIVSATQIGRRAGVMVMTLSGGLLT